MKPSIFLLLLAALYARASSSERPPCGFPAIYNFGDSNSDTGGISAAFQPTPWPYGETFFKQPVGRASDGRQVIDFMAERLELPYLSAYLNSIGANFSHGANFATGGSTIRRQNETIFQNGISPFSLDVQIWHYDQFRSRTTQLYNQVGFRKMSNDQIQATLPDILSHFSAAIQHLYEEGARSFWIHNTGPIGCLPVSTLYVVNPQPGFLDQYGCVKGQNDMALEFNKQLKDTVAKLRNQLPQAAITYVDVYAAKYGLISTAKNQGFEDPMKICCGYHEKDGHVWCGQKGQTLNGTSVFGASCNNPEAYISWDAVHYTESANHWFANHILNGSLSDPPVPITLACYRD
ncbi:hypothetical protein V2J09_011632 [Rumex salicifolius]